MSLDSSCGLARLVMVGLVIKEVMVLKEEVTKRLTLSEYRSMLLDATVEIAFRARQGCIILTWRFSSFRDYQQEKPLRYQTRAL